MARLTKQELTEIAVCLRIGAQQDRKDAAANPALSAQRAFLASAEYREKLAERFDKAATSVGAKR
ncbi:MAG TPA: hypothetical protein VIW26_16670 [Gemmatimonadales bacterium]|jgi:hypothetical protein